MKFTFWDALLLIHNFRRSYPPFGNEQFVCADGKVTGKTICLEGLAHHRLIGRPMPMEQPHKARIRPTMTQSVAPFTPIDILYVHFTKSTLMPQPSSSDILSMSQSGLYCFPPLEDLQRWVRDSQPLYFFIHHFFGLFTQSLRVLGESASVAATWNWRQSVSCSGRR